jgi:hypothetical protein
MSNRERLRLDSIGYWSEIKLDIVREYAKAYSTILTAQKRPKLHHVYIDAYAGAGARRSALGASTVTPRPSPKGFAACRGILTNKGLTSVSSPRNSLSRYGGLRQNGSSLTR